jgi:hypothetical protein
MSKRKRVKHEVKKELPQQRRKGGSKLKWLVGLGALGFAAMNVKDLVRYIKIASM